ncbi:hypothetical protein FQR65_LT12602 [Abscondita terminalis]|nr:hypothetical protein FQR65_LT12602 [Abscondita terminalis]
MPLTDIKDAISRFNYFDKWDEIAITQCRNIAKIRKYSKDRIILGDSFGFSNYVYFVLTGECRLIEELSVKEEKSKNGNRYKLYISNEEHIGDGCKNKPKHNQHNQHKPVDGNDVSSNIRVHFVQVCIFSPLSCFGFGEQMERRRIITTEPTECLLIPLYWLMQHNINNIWSRVQIFLKRIVARNKRSSNNYLYNVPYHIRINEIT